ncbi:uncharacterized protein LOC136040599 [Artemia franciscana]|uniref:Uncharacterized protein n=1 Tax=Artemia franciscana TaxID=6661 RepID=A0AA88HNP9_ARTSF|nr:hypothetical protein QYM36_009500 [Artemia franciscana]KAK2713644.1 hypothetical protein QYM36_009500 [Artemia franciscana]
MLKHMRSSEHLRTPSGGYGYPTPKMGSQRYHKSYGARSASTSPTRNLNYSNLNGGLNLNSSQLNGSNYGVNHLSLSKHSIGGNSSSISPGTTAQTKITNLDQSQHSIHDGTANKSKLANGGVNLSKTNFPASGDLSKFVMISKEAGIKEMLSSLGLLSLLSLLLAILALVFLLKISPLHPSDVRTMLSTDQVRIISAEEYITVFEVTLALAALTLSLNLCCLLVCTIQFLFAVRLIQVQRGRARTSKFLRDSAITRVCAIAGFFFSIPVFLTGVILYTIIQFHSTPAIITSIFIGLGIIFCGCAMVHNVFIWQREQSRVTRSPSQTGSPHFGLEYDDTILSRKMGSPLDPAMTNGIPPATLDLSVIAPAAHELSTLV